MRTARATFFVRQWGKKAGTFGFQWLQLLAIFTGTISNARPLFLVKTPSTGYRGKFTHFASCYADANIQDHLNMHIKHQNHEDQMCGFRFFYYFLFYFLPSFTSATKFLNLWLPGAVSYFTNIWTECKTYKQARGWDHWKVLSTVCFPNIQFFLLWRQLHYHSSGKKVVWMSGHWQWTKEFWVQILLPAVTSFKINVYKLKCHFSTGVHCPLHKKKQGSVVVIQIATNHMVMTFSFFGPSQILQRCFTALTWVL